MPKVHVTSEIGALRTVLVHTPGKELVAVTPGTREDYLYDDIIDLEIAQREHAIIGSMRHGVRWTEELLIKALFRYDRKFENAGILYDGSDEKRINYTLEGGDVHPLRPDLMVLGFSERSSPAALDLLCELVFAHCSVTDVIIVVLPSERTAIHLDMIFTQVDRDLCVVYPPHFVGPERLAVLHRRKPSEGAKEVPNL